MRFRPSPMQEDLKSLAALLAHAERERDEALAEQFRAEAACRTAAAQAEQLVAYRRDYEKRWRAEFCRDGKIELVRCYHGFMQRMTDAVEQQQRIAARAAMLAERAEAVVRGHELRTAGLRKLVERRVRAGEVAATRFEQRESDDRAVRAAWTRLTAPGRPTAL